MPQPEKGTIDLRIPESIDAAGRLLEKLWIMSPYLVWTVLFMLFFAGMYLINQVGNRRTEKDLDEAVNYSAKKRRSKKKRNGAKEERR